MYMVWYIFPGSGTDKISHFNPIALRKANIVCNFGLSVCSRVKLVCESMAQCDLALNDLSQTGIGM